MSRDEGAVCCVQGQTFTRTSTLGAGWGEYTHLCTSVPRKWRPWVRSVMKKRQLGTRPGVPVAASDWPGRFPDGGMEDGTW